MSRFRMFALFVAASLSVASGWSQAPTDETDATIDSSSKPVAFVYVTRPTHLDGFAVSSAGKLTPVPGSPFANIAASSLSVNKKFLFAAGDNNADIYTFSIASDGAIKQVSEVNPQKYSPDCGTIGPLQIDNTGSTVYVDCPNAGFIQSYRIESNGDLQYLGSTSAYPTDVIELFPPIRFIGDNKVAWSTGFSDDDGIGGPVNLSYERKSDGSLTYFTNYNDAPNTKNPDDFYVPFSLATDSTDHVVFALQEFSTNSGEFVGNFVLATYTATSNGKLTTTSTYKNMPVSDLSDVDAMSLSPSGKLLAVGSQGFQVFHFNGASPITKYTGLLQPKENFEELGWDKNNHLFAVSGYGLYVYDATTTSVKQASGSPYPIPEASSMIVLDN